MNRLHRQRGSSLPETAIVMAVVLALLFGIIDFGRAIYTYGFVANIAREGARWAIVRGSLCTKLDHCPANASDVQAYVRGLSEGATDPTKTLVNTDATHMWPGNSGPDGVIINCTPGTGTAGANNNNAAGCPVVVTVTYQFKFILPYLPVGPGIPMSSTSQMIIAQ
ncbi:MAG: TadE family protein [Candidatus Tumulicola sp.]